MIDGLDDDRFGELPAKENMEIDAQMLSEISQKPVHSIRFYAWSRPSLTYGYFVDPQSLIDLEAADQTRIEIAKRPTGGGVYLPLHRLYFFRAGSKRIALLY